MAWTLKDKQDYVAYLQKEHRKEVKKPETIARAFNLNEISNDLNSIDLTH